MEGVGLLLGSAFGLVGDICVDGFKCGAVSGPAVGEAKDAIGSGVGEVAQFVPQVRHSIFRRARCDGRLACAGGAAAASLFILLNSIDFVWSGR